MNYRPISHHLSRYVDTTTRLGPHPFTTSNTSTTSTTSTTLPPLPPSTTTFHHALRNFPSAPQPPMPLFKSDRFVSQFTEVTGLTTAVAKQYHDKYKLVDDAIQAYFDDSHCKKKFKPSREAALLFDT